MCASVVKGKLVENAETAAGVVAAAWVEHVGEAIVAVNAVVAVTQVVVVVVIACEGESHEVEVVED